jgi:DNA-binding winged helix-turn-helix (wHTH) protein/tetratricopeptide (TPR) repeat protein
MRLEYAWRILGILLETKDGEMSAPIEGTSYNFGPFRLYPTEHLLVRGDVRVSLAPKAFELLSMLVARHGRLISRDELMKAIWPDSFVEEINLTVNISLLRKLLGEQPDGRAYIATVPKRGYRFDAPVVENSQSAKEASQPIASELSARPAPAGLAGALPGEPAQIDKNQSRPHLPWKWWTLGLVAIIVVTSGGLIYRRYDPGSRKTENPQARELCMKGSSILKSRSAESVRQSLDLFGQAIDADPHYAAAYSGLADAYILAGSYGNSFLSPQVAMPKAKAAAEKALALDDTSPAAHTSLAYIKLVYDWDWSGAEAEFKRALLLDPNYMNAHHWYSHELMAEGRIPESHEQSELALGIAPTDVLMNEHMAWHHLMAREYDRAIPQALKTIELNPDFVQAHRVLGLAFMYTDRFKEACAEFQKGVDLSHNDPVARAYLARCYARSHRNAEAQSILDTLIRDSSERYVSAAEIAGVYAALSDTDKTLEWLDKACGEHASALIYLNIDPVYDPMRPNPQFQAIVRRINLVPLIDEPSQK